jgi:hypothetical protein
MTTPENPFQTTGFQGSTYQPSTYTASQARASGYGAAQSQGLLSGNGNASTYQATTRDIDEGKDTVAGQFNNLTSQGSPLMTMARTNAKQQALGRGLLNSSMAVGAGEVAAYQAALPIAQQDASHNLQQGMANQQVQNQASQFNAGQTQQNNQFNAHLQTQNNQFNAQSTNQARQFSAAEANRIAQVNVAAQEAAGQFNANAHNQAGQFNAQSTNQAQSFTADAINKGYLANLDAQTRQNLLDAETQNRSLLMTMESGSKAWMTAIESLGQVLGNPNLNRQQQDAAVQSILNQIKPTMTFLSAISGQTLPAPSPA